jgi:tetratricopeptide (TPR) repeat protein
MEHRHIWLQGGTRATRDSFVASYGLPPGLIPATIDAHRRLRGPYTMAGVLAEQVVPDALRTNPALVQSHEVELLSVSVSLRQLVPATRDTLTSLAVPTERTRFYSPMRTLRLAHGLTEFFRDYAATGAPWSIRLENIEHAEPTDLELLAVMARRLDPSRLSLVIGSGSSASIPEPIATALQTWTLPVDLTTSNGKAEAADVRIAPADPEAPTEVGVARAEAYVNGDCVSDEPALVMAYDSLPLQERSQLHDRRAAALDAAGDHGSRIGALPFHLEHGTNPTVNAPTALRAAMEYCIDMGFYEATIDLAERGRKLTTWDSEQADDRWAFTTKMTTSLAAVGRAAEAETLYNEVRSVLTLPLVHMQAAYATAMLYTRHHDPELRNNLIAKGWANLSIALASTIEEPKLRAFQTAFNRNGLALIEVHGGNLTKALEIVTECLASLDRELDPDDHRLHRSVLLYNRGQVHAGLGRLDEAIADYNAVIALDPNYAEYYQDRGSLLRRIGDDEAALADYEMAIQLSPPFAEVYYNRADTRANLGDIEGAIDDFSYVIDLDPNLVDAYVNRAGLLTQLGELDRAKRDVQAGLALDPENVLLLCIGGQLSAMAGRPLDARQAFNAALHRNPDLMEGLLGRAALSYSGGALDQAVADLDRALTLEDTAIVRFNRAVALQAQERWADALTDLERAAALAPDDDEVLAAQAHVRQMLAISA